jgi:ABC-type multidrug transport system permease subunit
MESRRNQILNSFQYVRDSIAKFLYEQPFIFVVILILFILSSISRIFKLRLKKKYIEPYEWS